MPNPNRSAPSSPHKVGPVKLKPVKLKPRYSEVADLLRLAILTEHYPVGGLLPSESELCRQYGVSRHTVREATRLLQLRGLVSRRQGRGTEVVASTRTSRVVRLLGSIDEVERHGRDTRLVGVRTSLIEADEELAASLPCSKGERILKIESFREPRDASTPWPRAWNESYIRAPYVGIRDSIETWQGAIYSLVEQTFGLRITSIRQEVCAVNLPSDLARRLNVKTATAALRVKRSYLVRSGEPVLFGFNTYVGDQFAMIMDIKTHE